MGDLSQRIGLIHELTKLICTKKAVDNTGNGTRIDQILRRKVLSITQVHALFDGTRHARKAKRELGCKLFSNGPHATITQVVNIIYRTLAVPKAD